MGELKKKCFHIDTLNAEIKMWSFPEMQTLAPQCERCLNKGSSLETPSIKVYIYIHRSLTLPYLDRVSHYRINEKPEAEEIPRNPQG